jgi:predicted Zn-dependent protease with MMP-like domain
MEREAFEKAVTAALESLHEKFAKQLENVEVVIDEWLTREDLRSEGLRPNSLLFGLYYGVPKTKRGVYYSALPDKITIFAGPILAVAKDMDDAKKIIRDTVLHEIGHYFGMSDAQIRKARQKDEI